MKAENKVQEARRQFFGRIEASRSCVDPFVQGKPLKDIVCYSSAPDIQLRHRRCQVAEHRFSLTIGQTIISVQRTFAVEHNSSVIWI